MGTPDDLRALVAAAHGHGIRILFDVVMNHPGYLDITTAASSASRCWPGRERDAQRLSQLTDYNKFPVR
jgi:alpha-amylase